LEPAEFRKNEECEMTGRLINVQDLNPKGLTTIAVGATYG
jgi:hypothetical protein